MNIQNMFSSKGNPVTNQFTMTDKDKEIFQSYKSIICIKENGRVHLSWHYDYSRTTMKYLSDFLGHGVAETRKRIETGEYQLDINTDGNKIKEIIA